MNSSAMNRAAVMVCVLLVGAWNAGQAADITLTVSETEGVGRSPACVTTGVPFAKGAVKDLSKLTVSLAGKTIPAQFTKTVAWDDGSIRWALLDTQVPVAGNGKVEIVVSDGGGSPAPTASVKVTEGADGVTVNTGPMQFTVSKTKGGLFQSVTVNGKELVQASAKGLLVVKDDGGEVAAGAPAEVKVESGGPMKATIMLTGTFPDVHRGMLGYTARVTAYAGQPFLKTHFWLENRDSFGYYRPKRVEDDDANPPDTMRWFSFSGMSVNLDLGLGEKITASCEGVEAAEKFRIFQSCVFSKPGVKGIYSFGNLYYEIGSKGDSLKKGSRTDGIVTAKGTAGAATVAIRDFWQNYEKAIELDGNTVKLWLWPVGGRYPRHEPDLRALTSGCGWYDSRLNALNDRLSSAKALGYLLRATRRRPSPAEGRFSVPWRFHRQTAALPSRQLLKASLQLRSRPRFAASVGHTRRHGQESARTPLVRDLACGELPSQYCARS